LIEGDQDRVADHLRKIRVIMFSGQAMEVVAREVA